jgi:hypothetical protein
MLKWVAMHPSATYDHVGAIPLMVSERNPQRATEQLNAGYGHGGGWRPFDGFAMGRDHSLKYPGDPPLRPLAQAWLRDELIIVYEHAWVAVVQPDGSFEVCRMD